MYIETRVTFLRVHFDDWNGTSRTYKHVKYDFFSGWQAKTVAKIVGF